MRENSEEEIEKRFTKVFHRDMTMEERRCFYLSKDRQVVAETDSGRASTSFGPQTSDKGEPHFLNSAFRIVERYVPLPGSDPDWSFTPIRSERKSAWES